MDLISNIVFTITLSKLVIYAYLILIILALALLIKISRDKSSKFNLISIVSNPDGSASLTRILQLTAGITATWVIINYTINLKLGVEMFAVYLAAMGISEGFTKYLQSKANKNDVTTN